MSKKRDYQKQVLQIDAAQLNKLRLAQKLTVTALARKAGVCRNVIYEAIKGNPSTDGSIIKLADALGVEVCDLVKAGEA